MTPSRRRAAASTPWLHAALLLRLTVRQFTRSPAASIYGALTLAIGFGAAIAIYSVMNGFTAPLPVPDGESVIQVQVLDPQSGRTEITPADVRAWRVASRSVEAIGAFSTASRAVHAPDRASRVVEVAATTANVFELLGVQPFIGRLPAERLADRDAAVISARLWRDWLAADDRVLGRRIRIGDDVHLVIGVMPDGFHFPYRQDLWTVRDLDAGAWSGLEVVGRLRPGAELSTAGEELQAILARSRLEATSVAGTARVRVAEFTSSRGEGGETTILLGLLMLVLALLLVSCANVANLLLEKSVVRARTLAVHQALGARPGLMVLQVLSDALLVALLGLVPGVAIAQAVVWFVEATLSDHWGYYWMRVELAPSALAFAAALALATAVFSGILPAWRSRRLPLAALLQQEAKSTRGSRKSWLSWALMTGQITFSCLSVVAAVLMGIGLVEEREVLPSFPLDSVQWASVTFDGDRYQDAGARQRYRRRLLRELAAEPQVRAAALSTGLPGVRAPVRTLIQEGRSVEVEPPRVLTSEVSPDFFEVFDLRVLRGRELQQADAASAVAVVSEDFVRLHLGGTEAVGRAIHLRAAGATLDYRIVGVVANLAIYSSDRERDLDHVYVPIDQAAAASHYLIVRAAGDSPQSAVTAVARAAQAADPEVAVGAVQPLSDMLDYVRQFMETLGTLAVVGGLGAVVVVTIGLYGIVAFDVRRRIPEFALRLALGAGSGYILRRILLRGMALVVPGLALGLGATFLITPLLGIFLGGADSHDPRVFFGALVVYLFVSLLAAAGPARRAAFCNPAEVLRDE